MRKSLMLAAVALAAGSTVAVAGPPVPKDKAMQLLARPGSWIEVDGALLPDGTLNGKDIEIIAPGDTANQEDTAVYGAVQSLNRAKSTMRVLGYTVTWDEMTTIKDENKRKVLSSKIEEGMGVKVQGVLQPNGSYKATKIRVHANKDKAGKVKAKEKIFGPLQSLDPRGGKARVLNTPVTFREDATFIEVVPNSVLQ